jgi:hypothetical protein
LLAFHPSDATKTTFISPSQLQEYLASSNVKMTTVDFATSGYDFHFASQFIII